MAMKVRYQTINGEILSEIRGGVRKQYVPDPLGSTVALADSAGTVNDTFEYWPYGEVRLRTGTSVTPFQFVGTWGYYVDGTGRTYVRARYLSTTLTRWLIEDPIHHSGDGTNFYQYGISAPVNFVDASGLKCNPIIYGGCMTLCCPLIGIACNLLPPGFKRILCNLAIKLGCGGACLEICNWKPFKDCWGLCSGIIDCGTCCENKCPDGGSKSKCLKNCATRTEN